MVTIVLTWQWGISAMIAGMIGVSIFACHLNSYHSGVLVNYPITEQGSDLLPYLIVSVLMAKYGVWSMLLAEVAGGSILYVCLCRAFRLAAYMEVWHAMSNRMPFVAAGTGR